MYSTVYISWDAIIWFQKTYNIALVSNGLRLFWDHLFIINYVYVFIYINRFALEEKWWHYNLMYFNFKRKKLAYT